MCGIAAIVGTGAEHGRDDLCRMVDAVAHRGPDGRGLAVFDSCALGHARLSIIDLDSGDQPMQDASGRYSITFNGEIYNYASLRAELEADGFTFKTHSDTEVILNAYAHWGADALDRFRGMFAFAIWDANEQTLFAARDLFGEKPLFYAPVDGSGILVASEIKALLASRRVAPDLDLAAVDAYLAFGYVPPAMCIYRAIRPLPPGCWMRWCRGQLTTTRYWRPTFETRDIGLNEAAEQLRALLQRAVRRQMVADVPVGAFLSGGLDSASIVALMQQQSDVPVKTFSVGFGTEINELPFARAVADRYGTEHYEVDLGAPTAAGALERMAEVYDEPFADTSCIPTYLIAEFARRHVKVVLSGDGGDEMFGGYGWYPILARSAPLRGSRAAWLLLRAISRATGDRYASLHRTSVAVGLAARWPDLWLRAAMNQVYLRDDRRAMLWGARRDGHAFEIARTDVAAARVDGLNRAFYFDLTAYLPGDILVKVDRAAMAHGLETRAPFLDRDVAEFTLSLPPRLKADRDRTKIVLREACERFWPEAVRARGKHGFGAPYRRLLATADVRAMVAHVFRPAGALRQLLPGVTAADAAHSFETWMLLVLGLWLERRAAA